MGRKYSISGASAVASPTKSNVGLTGSTTVRPFVYDIVWGSTATPADNAIEWQLQRYTAAGTKTAFTPVAIDPADPAATSAGAYAHSAEPTYTSGAILLDVPMNQRSTQRWVASPGSEFKIPATSANGVGWQPIHASFTGNVLTTILFEE